MAQCTAKSKQSQHRCRRSATPGMDVCASHGSKAPQVKAAAARRAAAESAQVQLHNALTDAYGDKVPEIDPGEAMLAAVSWKYAEVMALRGKVATLTDEQLVWGTTKIKTGGDDGGTTEEARPNIWWDMLHKAEDQLVKYAAAARAAGVEERRVQIAEREGQLIAMVITRILAGLDLSETQQALVGVVVPRELRALQVGAA